MYQFIVEEKGYASWSINKINGESDELEICSSMSDPYKNKLFHEDIFDKDFNICDSKARNLSYIAGILDYNGKTFGRHKNGKFLYKVIPDNKLLPCFLIPYEEKKNQFNKVKVRKYVIFKFNNWNNKHPIGMLVDVLGDINDLKIFDKYLLYSKNLFYKQENIKFNHEDLNNIFDKRFEEHVITIDPLNTKDIDDAYSFTKNKLSVYIANVPIILDKLNLNGLINIPSTVYLSEYRENMLNKSLSEDLCSLLEGRNRVVLAMDIYLLNDNIELIEFKICNINVSKNYCYDDIELQEDNTYKKSFEMINKLNKNLKLLDSINDSHELIEFLMLLMNIESAKILFENNKGIFRNFTMKKDKNNIDHVTDINLRNFIKIWELGQSEYCMYNKVEKHKLINHIYCHITSPIRRIVDIINMHELINILNLYKFNNIPKYLEWKIESINNISKSIKKIQNESKILNKFVINPEILNTLYDCIIININLELNECSILIKEIDYICYLQNNNYELYKKYSCQLYLFEDGYSLKRKIRVKIII